MMFIDRREAGRRLGLVLRRDLGAERSDVVVIGVSPGGMVVASEIARMLGASLDVLVVRELSVSGRSGVFGAIGEGGVRVLDKTEVGSLGLGEAEVRAVQMRERIEVERQALRFRRERPRIPLAGTTAVIVDDGIASASTTRAACAIARSEGAARVVLAIPAVAVGRERAVAAAADELVALEAPYLDGPDPVFERSPAMSDEEVAALLESRAQLGRPSFDEDVEIDLGPVRLSGHLSMSGEHTGAVVFAQGGGSRHSPRNVFIAGELRRAGLGTLLFDLVTGAEERDRRKVFDIGSLAQRLTGVTTWLRSRPELSGVRIGYFGSTVGAAPALWAAGEPAAKVDAIVCWGGRPDLAEPRLGRVEAPTLLIVGGEDREALRVNHRAAATMSCPKRVWVVSGASHSLSEPGALETVADLARVWFGDHLLRIDRADASGRG